MDRSRPPSAEGAAKSMGHHARIQREPERGGNVDLEDIAREDFKRVME